MKDKDFYTVPLKETKKDERIKKTNHKVFRRDTVPEYQEKRVRKLLKDAGYRGTLVQIENTRVDTKNSFRVTLRDENGIAGKFLVNLTNKSVRFDGRLSDDFTNFFKIKRLLNQCFGALLDLYQFRFTKSPDKKPITTRGNELT